jgi:site-specific recombinase XerD
MTRAGQTRDCPGRFTDTPVWREYVHHLAVERQRRPSTIDAYANTLDRWGRFLGRRDWRQATSRDLGRFLAKGCGQGQRRAGQPLSDAVKRHYTAALKSFYRWAADAGHLERDPMAAVVLGRTPTPMLRDIPLADVRSLLVWVQGDERVELAVWLAYGAGLRVSEIAALRIEDVVLHGPRPHLRVLDSKYGRSRVVPLPPALRDVLGRYLAQRPGAGPVLTRRHPADGRPMTGKTVTDVIRGAMRAAGVKARLQGYRRLVFASSNHVTGLYPAGQRLDPEVPTRPDSLYGVSKAFGEQLGRLYAEKHGLEVVCVRIGTVADRPTTHRQLSTWLSPRDTVELFYRCLVAPDVGFTTLYGASANERGWWDLRSAERLGYRPADNAERWASQLEAAPTDPAESAEGPQGGGLARA